MDPCGLENGGNLGGLIGVVIVVAEHGDDRDPGPGQLGDEDLGLGRFPGAGEIAGQEENVGLVLQPGQERRERPSGLGPSVHIGDGGDTDHALILPRVRGVLR